MLGTKFKPTSPFSTVALLFLELHSCEGMGGDRVEAGVWELLKPLIMITQSGDSKGDMK